MKLKLSYVLAVVLVCLSVFTIYLAVQDSAGSTVCLTGSESDASNCQTVQNSEYGSILGVKVSYIGAVGVTLLAILFFLSRSKLKYSENFYEIYLLGTVIGAVGAIYFISIQLFVLKSICSSCVVVDSSILVVAALTWLERKRNKVTH